MPILKDLACHVQWAETGSAFPEYGTIYGDGIVETYIAIPSHPQVFTIRLSSRKFISEGLAMIIFIDGRYQCNRNRVNLEPAKKDLPENRSRVDFLVRQKEKPLGDGTYMGREWRFDDTNLVEQLPQGTDESHFNHLGTIEVLILRCRTKIISERAGSTSSSCEHSDLMDDSRSEETDSGPAPANTDRKSSNQSGKAGKPASAAESDEDMMGGLCGFFDGPADEPPPRHISADGPSDGYYDHWMRSGRPLPRYGPQEDIYHRSSYPPPPFEGRDPRPRRSFYGSSPPHTYARPTSPPGPEKHVHFDYGDGRGPPPADYDAGNHHIPYATWRQTHRPEYIRRRPSYHPREDHREENPYQDYFTQSDRDHYRYDAGRRTYDRPGEPWPADGSYRWPLSPSPEASRHHVYPHPANVATQSSGPPYSARTPAQHYYGPPPFVPIQANLSNPAPPAAGGPPIPPKVPVVVPLQAPQFQPQPVSQVLPAAVQPGIVPAWAYPGPHGPGYPPPGSIPFLPAQPPNFNHGLANTSIPFGVPVFHDNGPTPVRYDKVSDQNPASGNDKNGGTGGLSGNNHTGDNFAWPDATGNNSGGAKKDHPDTDWPDWKNNDSSKGNTDDNGGNNNEANKNDDWQNDNSGDNSGDNDQSRGDQNNNGQGWDANNTGNNSWDQNNQNQNSGNNQQNGDSWDTNKQNAHSNGWANDPNNKANSGNQQNNGYGVQDNPSGPANQPIQGAGRETNRVLYGPYGPYYGAKSLAQQGPPPDSEEEPRYDLPQAIAQVMGVTKQVQPGPGYLYVKKRCAPSYIDTFDEPYAKFVFKYRTKEQLKKEIGVETAGEPTGDEEVNALSQLDRGELISMLLRAKGALGGTIPEPPARLTPFVPNGFDHGPVPAPELSYLHYSLPPTRNVTNNNPGLGITYANSSGSRNNGGGNNNQNNNQQNNGGSSWQDDPNNNNKNSQDWNAGANPITSGWDGHQEPRNFSTNTQGTVQHHQYPQNQSRQVSGTNPAKNNMQAGPPPPQPIVLGASGTVGGGTTRWQDTAAMGAGPRPASPPPGGTPAPPRGYVNWADDGAGAGGFGGNEPAAPKHGW